VDDKEQAVGAAHARIIAQPRAECQRRRASAVQQVR
jgi:hypothetical protein